MGKDSSIVRKLVALTAVVALVAATAAFAATRHATGTFKGKTSQRENISLDVGATVVRNGHVTVRVTCVRNGRRRVLRDSAFIAGNIPINADGTFGSRQKTSNGKFELRIAGQIAGRRASGRYSEQFTGRQGTCRSGRVTWRVRR